MACPPPICDDVWFSQSWRIEEPWLTLPVKMWGVAEMWSSCPEGNEGIDSALINRFLWWRSLSVSLFRTEWSLHDVSLNVYYASLGQWVIIRFDNPFSAFACWMQTELTLSSSGEALRSMTDNYVKGTGSYLQSWGNPNYCWSMFPNLPNFWSKTNVQSASSGQFQGLVDTFCGKNF